MQRATLDQRLATIRIAQKLEAEIENPAVEIGNFIVGQTGPKHILGHEPALLDSTVPVLDAATSAVNWIDDAGDIACGEYVRLVGPEELVDDHAILDRYPAVFEKASVWDNANGHHDQITRKLCARLSDDAGHTSITAKGRDGFAQKRRDSMLANVMQKLIRNLRRLERAEKNGFLVEHSDGDAHLRESCRDFEAEEAGAEHDCTLGMCCRLR